jgi:hypothetical protein
VRRRRQRIPVEDRSGYPPPLEHLDRLSARLLAVDPDRHARLVALAEAWLAGYDSRFTGNLESDAEIELRVRAIRGEREPAN